MEKNLENQIQSIHEDVKKLREQSKTLTNGDRYRLMKDVENRIHPLQAQLRSLEHQMLQQETTEDEIEKQYQQLLLNITELKDFKSELKQKIDTENENNKKYTDQRIQQCMNNDVKPLRSKLEEVEDNINKVEDNINKLQENSTKNYENILKLDTKIDKMATQNEKEIANRTLALEKIEKEREIESAKNFAHLETKIEEAMANQKVVESERFQRYGKVMIAIAGVILTLITIETYLEPPIRHFFSILFGGG